MRVYLAISYFDVVGGSEEQLTVLAVRLKQLGHQVTVFNKLPKNTHSQYVQRLSQNRVRIVSPAPWISAILGDWYTQDKVVRALAKIAAPLLLPAALAIAIARRKPFMAAFQSAQGFFRSLIGKLIYADRRESLLRAHLNLWSFFARPDIFHVFRYDLHTFLPWAYQKGIPSIYYELITPNEDALLDQAWKTRSANINKTTLIHAISESTAKVMAEGLGITRPIDVVYPFLKDMPEDSAGPKKGAPGHLTITSIGRLSPEKGLSDLLVAAQKLLRDHPGLSFLIAGSGPLRESLEEQARALGIAEQVQFYGSFPHSELGKIMAATDIFTLPSYLEGLPFVIIEAMAYGKPVVATAIAGVGEVVSDQLTGFIVPPREPETLAGALKRLVEDESLRSRMGEAGREKVLNGTFSEEAFIDRVLAGYQKARQLAQAS